MLEPREERAGFDEIPIPLVSLPLPAGYQTWLLSFIVLVRLNNAMNDGIEATYNAWVWTFDQRLMTIFIFTFNAHVISQIQHYSCDGREVTNFSKTKTCWQREIKHCFKCFVVFQWPMQYFLGNLISQTKRSILYHFHGFSDHITWRIAQVTWLTSNTAKNALAICQNRNYSWFFQSTDSWLHEIGGDFVTNCQFSAGDPTTV